MSTRKESVRPYGWAGARAGERSVARRLLRAAAPSLADAAAARALGAAASDADLRRALERHAGHAHLAALAQARPPRSPAAHEALAQPERRALELLRTGTFYAAATVGTIVHA